MKKTIPVFILSSGRSGTYSFFKNLKNLENLKVNHEYLFEETLKNSVSYHMKIINEKKILEFIDKKYSLGIKKTKKFFWIDSSNALPWIIKPLKNKFKNARFVFLIRNGKKVVSSFYNKYKNVMYNKKDILILKKYFDKKIDNIPLDKKFWRPIPTSSKSFKYFLEKNQFSKICLYWSLINKTIRKNLASVKRKDKFYFKLENINKKNEFTKLLKFIGVKKKDIRKVIKKFNRPENVKKPINFNLTINQIKDFNRYCKDEMLKNNYKLEEYYKVQY